MSVARLLAQAAAHLQSGEPEQAIAPLRQAAALQPATATIHHDLGLACLDAGRVPDALAALQDAVTCDPHYARAWLRLGAAQERAGDAQAAIAAYHRATELLPSLAEAWFRAGALVFTLGHRERAVACFRRAASTAGRTGFGRLGAARALLAEERDAEAERVLRQALALDPANPMALDLLGNLLADAGRFDAARACFAAAIARAPLMAGSYYDLVRCRRITPADAGLLAEMDAALLVPGLDAAQRVRVHLALGKAQDDLGDVEAAMRHFDAAHEIRAAAAAFVAPALGAPAFVAPALGAPAFVAPALGAPSFDAAAFDMQVDRLIACFTPELVAAAPSLGVADATPLLIIGMPRSGTTLAEQILSSHPGVAAAGELNFWNERGAAWEAAGGAGLSPGFLGHAARDYLAVLRRVGAQAARVTDKMPFNFLWAGLIHLALPQATFIHCRRSAVATALSIHQTHFNPRLAFPTGGAALVAYIRSYERLTAHWRRVLPPQRFVEVEYERLTSSPEAEIRRVVAEAGLGWDDSCLHPERNARVVKTPSKWQARQAINRNSVDRWRRYEHVLGALQALVGDAGT